MSAKILGLHHLTAISGSPSENARFYTGTLGLRLVKKTVNFDDPSTYHLYYGNHSGSPGTLITFFPYQGPPGQVGPGQVSETVYGFSTEEYLKLSEKLIGAGLKTESQRVLGSERLRFQDPHGLPLALEQTPPDSPLLGPGEFAGVTLWVKDPGPTRETLAHLGFRKTQKDGRRERYGLEAEGSPHYLDLVWTSSQSSSRAGPGTVHHLALQVADKVVQDAWRRSLAEAGYRVSPVMDRSYFHSIYFRDPSGILFELATNPPGMLIDEDLENLGTSLRLPPKYEQHRHEIEHLLEPIGP